jgi:hypothetical protein
MVLREGLVLGIAVGLPASWDPTDRGAALRAKASGPVTIASATLLVVMLAALAGLLPASPDSMSGPHDRFAKRSFLLLANQ